MNTEEKLRALLNAIGGIAEVSLQYYRSIIGAGGTPEEATNLTKAFLESTFNTAKEKSLKRRSNNDKN